MLQDKLMILMDNLDINGAATTETISDNVFKIDGTKRFEPGVAAHDPINLAAAVNDLGRQGKAQLNVAVGDTGWYCTGGTGTVDIRVYHHTGATVTSGSIVLSVNIPGIVITAPAAKLVAGSYLFGLILPKDLWGDTTNIYIGLAAIANTQTLTAATVNAWISDSRVG